MMSPGPWSCGVCHVSSGAACSSAEAEEVVAVLHSAGVVLRHHDTVYLRPAEIAELVMQVSEWSHQCLLSTSVFDLMWVPVSTLWPTLRVCEHSGRH